MSSTIQLTAIDHHFATFINKHDSNPCDELWLAASLTSSASIRGHVCLDLAEASQLEAIPFKSTTHRLVPPDPANWAKILKNCRTVGQPGDYTPLVLDEAGRLYLHRSWKNERQVANEIRNRLAPLEIPIGQLQAGLDRYFPHTDELDWQRVAATAALTQRFTVISGGPGTGKTSTVARILALLLDLSDKPPVITLAAPTGKAAMRLRQSILTATDKLGLTEQTRASLPDKVHTIHRLLGVIPNSPHFRHNATNRLKCDCLIVDELSMVDLPLMARLLEALPSHCRLILLGDRDQLASVEAGAVMADICNHGVCQPFSTRFTRLVEQCCGQLTPGAGQGEINAISDSIIHLRKSYRFGAQSGIGILSRLINEGDGSGVIQLLRSGDYDDIIWRPLPGQGSFESSFQNTVRGGFGDYLRSTTPQEALEQLERFRVLTPHREGPTGVERLNLLAERALGLQADGHGGCRLQPLMMTANNYDLGLFNGDTAVVMDDPQTKRLRAFFLDPERGLLAIAPLRLPSYQTAFAMTVHKSQGSEFDTVLLILPEQRSEVLSRQLFYTAVTRARSRIEIWGSEGVIIDTIERSIRRSSGLRDQLWGS